MQKNPTTSSISGQACWDLTNIIYFNYNKKKYYIIKCPKRNILKD